VVLIRHIPPYSQLVTKSYRVNIPEAMLSAATIRMAFSEPIRRESTVGPAATFRKYYQRMIVNAAPDGRLKHLLTPNLPPASRTVERLPASQQGRAILGWLMARLREIRRGLRLSLREVEQHSRRIAQERRDSSYLISARWLSRLGRYEQDLEVNKLLALAEIYRIPVNQLRGLSILRTQARRCRVIYPARTRPNRRRKVCGKCWRTP
jgi:hypothetical protein